jgi:hypothetical protein
MGLNGAGRVDRNWARGLGGLKVYMWITVLFFALLGYFVSTAEAQPSGQPGENDRANPPSQISHPPESTSPCCLADCECEVQSSTSWLAKIGQAVWRPIRQIGIDYTQNRIWPEPYSAMDRATIGPAYFRMVANGWQQQTLLGDPHFAAGQDRLSEAGKAKVQWIACAVPPERRVIFIHSPDPGIGGKRQEAVRRYLESLQLQGPPPPIVLTLVTPRWASGTELGLVHQKFQESTPNPRLPPYQPYQVQSP